MEIKVQNLTLNEEKRILCMSDIHGNFLYFKNLLELLHYDEQSDYLILLGDLIEKGNESLKVLRFVMNLPNTYVLMGNCEYVRTQIFLKNPAYLASLKSILLQDKYPSILKEMQAELHLNIESLREEEIIDQFNEKFADEINFLLHLPHVLEHEKIRFVHAGTMHESISENTLNEILTIPNFHQICPVFKKWCVVGHYPTVNYSKKIPSFNPIIDYEKKVISIDGGNIVSPYGQLNALVISSLKTMKFSYKSYEKRILLTIPFEQKENEDSFYLSFLDAEVKIIGDIDDKVALVKTNEHVFAIAKSEISHYHGKTYVFNYTNYYMPVKKFDKVYLYKQTPFAYLVKKNGILGWVRKEKKNG